MNDEERKYIGQWLEKADEDLLVVRQLLTMDVQARGVIGFHCQQAAEKFLKAFILANNSDIPRTHNIEFLLEMCKKIDQDFSSIEPGNLTDYGVEMRYPGDFIEPTLQEIGSLVEIVQSIKELTHKKIVL
jgi:HEPN domain-containing protein